MISRSGFLLLNAKHKGDIKGKLLKESIEKEDISLSPLATPLLAGPGTISLLINLSIENPELLKTGAIMIAILCIALCIYGIFSIAPRRIEIIFKNNGVYCLVNRHTNDFIKCS